ncbi:Inner membrane transport permease yadH [Leclercia adecarboxylata]|uniref:Inner membrane transport permease yadH n=1 Tax=Leclercia adecarboxylata TaxID=83655 RepID=A0A4U9HJN8_9ENTR|nr:Inner membrane transport permease yadH [Leclercia adecarboxylata]
MMQLYWVALKSIWAKEINRFMRIWIQTPGAAGDHHDSLTLLSSAT